MLTFEFGMLARTSLRSPLAAARKKRSSSLVNVCSGVNIVFKISSCADAVDAGVVTSSLGGESTRSADVMTRSGVAARFLSLTDMRNLMKIVCIFEASATRAAVHLTAWFEPENIHHPRNYCGIINFKLKPFQNFLSQPKIPSTGYEGHNSEQCLQWERVGISFPITNLFALFCRFRGLSYHPASVTAAA